MTWEEREIINYLKTAPRTFFSAREIARRAAGKKVYRETPDWAKPHLPRLVERGFLERNPQGHYRLQRADRDSKSSKWLSPHLAKILRDHGDKMKGIRSWEIDEDESVVVFQSAMGNLIAPEPEPEENPPRKKKPTQKPDEPDENKAEG